MNSLMISAKIILGDCLDKIKNIKNESIDLTVTSPPYDNLRTYNGNISQWSFKKFQEIAKELYRVTKKMEELWFGLLEMQQLKEAKPVQVFDKHYGLWTADLSYMTL